MSDKEKRNTQIKVTGTESLQASIKDFLARFPKVQSQNDLADAAFRYFMRRYEQAGGATDGEGFPLDGNQASITPLHSRAGPRHKGSGRS